jgi:hypothetical protein
MCCGLCSPHTQCTFQVSSGGLNYIHPLTVLLVLVAVVVYWDSSELIKIPSFVVLLFVFMCFNTNFQTWYLKARLVQKEKTLQLDLDEMWLRKDKTFYYLLATEKSISFWTRLYYCQQIFGSPYLPNAEHEATECKDTIPTTINLYLHM